ncbi:serine/threonine-protein kinase fused [Condylostylus longicornis]|uniref:serine/threonine-protein kinase fused n=1 Tax=Condylostylus longicornis TaxID=2530218 RepID=UPI00244E3471|nr:serine/threonine-protein kinase fused [Condylostylus longicornis]
MEKYSVTSMIGEGSFGRVYKATRKSDNHTVALKVILKRGRSSREIKNLRRECEIQAELKHENIIEMFESFETKNDLVVVTEFSQIDLHRYLSKNGTISEETAQKLNGHLVSALYYLHSNRILHRDLKPQNVLLDENLHAKLCDFGLARNMTLGTHVLTSIKGTPLYMAPELLSEKPYNHQADLWSLGCIIYETLVGQPPFCTTSILHLVRLIRLEEVKFPSFVGNDCTSFLQGLLEKDPTMRMTWAQILFHPFTENRLNLPEGCQAIEPDFTKNKSTDKSPERDECDNNITEQLDLLTLEGNKENKNSLDSSNDSTNAILQSDIENIETDAEDINRINIPFSDAPSLKYDLTKKQISSIVPKRLLGPKDRIPIEIPDIANQAVGGNMVINFLNDNFKQESSAQNNPIELGNMVVNFQNENFQQEFDGQITKTSNDLSIEKLKISNKKSANQTVCSRNKDLERRKLSQNLDNFSLRLGQSHNLESVGVVGVTRVDVNPNYIRKQEDNTLENKDSKKCNSTNSAEEKLSCSENTPPCLLPGWDSCDESQSPPIENEEWLAFLRRSMQEILDGEMESLQQQNLVSIIVAPLRNVRASSIVIENVAKLFSLPLVLDKPNNVLESIKNVYIEVKLVPNLMYASRIITTHKLSECSQSSSTSFSGRQFKTITELTDEEIHTLSLLYELTCYLVHLNEKFLIQFCDAVAILPADALLILFLSHDSKNKDAISISNYVIAILCYVLRELPENAELVERIIFSDKLNLIALMRNADDLIRLRLCMLFRLLVRFSLRGLQNIWSTEFKETIESLIYDPSDEVREEAEFVVEELKQFSFYS